MAGSGDLKEDLLLALEHDLPVIDPAREIHQPVNPDQFLGTQPAGRSGLGAGNRNAHLSYSLSRFPRLSGMLSLILPISQRSNGPGKTRHGKPQESIESQARSSMAGLRSGIHPRYSSS